MPFATRTVPADSKQYIIGRLYHDFSEIADILVQQFADYSGQVVPDLVPFFAPAMEGKLGQTIRTMAKVGRSCAKEVVEILLQWRRGLLEATETSVELPTPQSPSSGHGQPHSPLPTMIQTTPSLETNAPEGTGRRGSSASAVLPVHPSGPEPTGNAVRLYHLETAQERQTIAAVYILCSALIAVFNELQPQDIPDEIGSVVEELTFVQLTNIDLESLSGCPNRQVIAQLYAELIGSISCVRFATMSDRFIAELERIPSGPLTNEHQVELTIRGMRFLRLKIYPVDALEETAQFLYSCTKFFARRSQGTAIKYAYYEVFTQLLLPIAAVADAEVNFPDWVRSMDMLLPRATKAAAKPRYLHVAWPFLTAVLCTSRRDVFLNRLPAFLDQAFQRMRDRNARNVALGCVCRIVWAYLFRYTESEKETYRRLESLVRLMFGTRKRPLALVDLPLDYYVYIVFCLLRFSRDWTIRNVFSFLLHTDDWNPLPLTLESLSPERATIGLRALLLYLQSDAQKEKRPPFPSSQDLLVTNPQPFALPSYPRLAEDVGAPALPWDDSAFQLTEQVEMAQSKYYFLLDANYGDDLATKKRFVTFDRPQHGVTSLDSTPDSLDPSATPSVDVTPAAAISSDVVGGTRLGGRTQAGHRSHIPSLTGINQTGYPTGSSLVGLASTTRELTTEGQEYQHHFHAFSTVYGKERQPYYDLLTTSIDITPDVLPSQIANEKLAEMLVKYLLHVDLCVARAASRGLVRLARRIGAYHIIGLMASTLTQVQDRMREILNHHIYLPEPKETQSQTKPTTRRKMSRGQPWGPPVSVSAPRPMRLTPGTKDKNLTTTASVNTADQSTTAPRGYQHSQSGSGGLLNLYVDLLELLVAEIDELDSKYQLETVADRWKTDHKAIIHLIDQVEMFGLFYLFYCSSRVRRLALAILQAAARIGETLMPHLSDDHPIPMTPTERVRVKLHDQMITHRRFIYSELAHYQIPVSEGADTLGHSSPGWPLDQAPVILPSSSLPFHRYNRSTSSSNGSDLFSLTQGDSPLPDGPQTTGHAKEASHYPEILPEPFINAPYPQSTQSLTPPSGPSLPLLEIAQSSRYSHRMLWSAYLTWVVHKVYDIVPQVTLYTRARVCSHFHQLYSLIVHYSDVPSPIPALSYISGRLAGKSDTVDLELVEQWRNFLGFISATLLRNLDSELLRYRISDVLSDKNMMNINNTSELVKLLKPLFYCENPMIRQAVVHGLGCIHESSYADLIKALHPQMKEVYQVTMLKSSHKSYSTLKRDQKVDRLRGVLVHILRLTARHLSCTRYLEDERLLDYQTAFVDEIGTFLQDAGIQNTWDYQNLRIQFCGLVDVLFYYVSLLPHSTTMFPFKYRHTFFNMFEDWCGFGEHSERTRLREAEMMTNVLEKYVDVLERGTVTSMMEEERTALEGAALRAMATLCRGTISATEDDAKSISGNSPLPQFDISKLFRWIETIFASADRRVHGIARHSLEWLLEFNRAYPQVLEAIIYRCYARDPADKATHGYFFALHKVITTNPHYPYDCHGMLVLALLKMGDMDPGIRRSAFHLVQSLERRFFRDRCYEAFVSAALSPLATLYRHALLGLSATMSERHPHLTNSFIFEVCSRLELVTEPQQRGMLRFLRPWFCNLQLRYCPVTKRLRDPEHCYLTHLFYLTLTLSKKHLGELEQLWSALVYGDNTRNCDMVVGFLIHAVLTRRNPALLEFVKKVVIFLARTNVSTHLVNTIMSYVTPTLMTPSLQMPWLGDIVATDMSDQDKASLEGGHTSACPGQEMFNEQFPVYSEGPLLSPGQIALIMLVELPSEMGWLLRPYLPDLLHPLVLHVDHLYPRVSEFLATLLANFTRYVVLDHHDPLESVDFLLAQVDVDYIRQREGKLSLTDLHRLVYSLSDLFAVTVGLTPNEMRHRWAQVALMWGTRCAVLIMATTSFRIFNVFIPKVSLGMCLEMVSRLSNVMADDTPEVNQFTACILAIFTKALRQIPHDTTEYHASALLALDNGLLDQAFDPQRTRDALIPFLFWVATVCLVSHLEAEYEQGLTMLEPILQNPLWRFPSLHHTEHLLHDKPLHLQAQMGYPIATLAAQRSSSTSLDRVNPADALPEPTPPWSLRDAIRYYYPEKWKQSFPGIFWLLIRGFRFAHQRALCQRMLIQLIPIAADSLVGIQDVAAVLLLVMDFPLLCQAIQQEYTDSEEAELYVEMVAVIVPDVVTGSETARRALLNVCKKFKAHEYYGIKQFIKDIVQLAGNHFPKHTMDMLFLFLFQLPDTPLAHQEMLLQAMEMLVDQYRSYVTGLFDRDDTLAMVNILLSLMASPSLEPKVTNILESLVLRSGNHIAPIFAQQLQPPRPYSNDKATTWHITLPPAGATRAGSRIDAVTTFSWYGFNSKVSREKIRSLLDFLLQGIATHLRSDTPFSDTNPDNTPSPYLDGSSGSISDPSPMSYPESRINSPVPYFGSPLASVAYESSLFSDDSVDAHLPLSEHARSSSVSAGGFQPRITSADDAIPSDLVDMTTLDKIIPQLQDLGDFFSTDSTTYT